MRTFFRTALLIAALGLLAPVGATSFSVDNSDQYWNAGESGWGFQAVQRKEVIFVTLFVYNSSNTPVWYTATLEPSGPSTWSGDLIVTSGSFFGAVPFNPATVTRTKVGTMTLTVNSDTAATLVYTVDAVTVTKAVVRQTLRVDDYSGSYVGVLHQVALACPDPLDRIPYSNRIDFDVTQSGPALTILSQQQGQIPVCQSTGALTTNGQFASSHQVTSSCTDGNGAGDIMEFTDINITPSGITMNFTAPSSNFGSKGCNFVGSIFGVRQ